ncbi:extracellular solute-binding protein [Luteibacter anthropi]|uniref:extracellular solute-binding protein n=1 Tax=Luteibacter anthropi TaxID=564369 RepID=UPI0020326B1F|nr:extracellular solute-binding protein [Luteibacter anthropi]URX61997.1 extracellular solute-binding protein [Luteibacter anthropi]
MRHAFGNTRTKLVAGAVLLCLATAASAQSAVIVGGGATLPAVGYAGATADRLMTPDAGSLLAAYDSKYSLTSTYCQTGSGGGKNVLNGLTRAGNTAPDNVNIACVAPNPSTAPIGFGGTNAGQVQPHFVGSDSPLSSSDYANYVSGHSATANAQPVQIPSVAGAISIVYNQPLVKELHLNETQVCQIFSGQIKTWQDPALASAIVRTVPTAAPTGNISVVYRSDGSGTSFAFSNHLTAKCGNPAVVGSTFGANNIAPNFQTNQDFLTAVSAYANNYFAKLPASGNPAVVTTIRQTSNSIGYAETANSLEANTQRAFVKNDADGTDNNPVNFGTGVAVTTVTDQVISGTGAGGRPTLAAISSPAQAGCVRLVDPAAYATPATGYPIIAVSYFLGNNKGNGADVTSVRNLLTAPYDATIQSNASLIGAGHGLSFLSGVDTSFVGTCVN